MLRSRILIPLAIATLFTASAAWAADDAAEKQSFEELRNTVINLLQALVDKGLLTRDQAQQLVKQAQDKASASASAAAARGAAQAKEEENAVRVPYVPQIVKDEISQQVAAEVKPELERDLVAENRAMPDWLSRLRLFGDVTVRAQANWYPTDNSFNQLLNYNNINAAGGFTKTSNPYLNTTDDLYELRLRARLGVEATLTDQLHALIRLSTGSLTNQTLVAGSESQTLGQYGARYPVGIDLAYIRYDSSGPEALPVQTVIGGRIPNPWFSPTELEFARDLTFEGIASTTRIGWADDGPDRPHVYLTLAGFPMLVAPFQASGDKWMLGAQLGTDLHFNDDDDRLLLAAAYYDYINVTGQLNAPNSTMLNYTAPPFVQFGNTMFNIANNPTDPTVQLFALAAHFRIADLAAQYEHEFDRYSLAVAAQAARNVGYNLAQIEAMSGQSFSSAQNRGYVGEISFGDPVADTWGTWRAAVGYRYVQADALLDAWTDADFHQGGTNAAGYYFWARFGLAYNTYVRLRYMSGNELSGPRYGLDILQIDVGTRF
jgi:hypothetical protein